MISRSRSTPPPRARTPSPPPETHCVFWWTRAPGVWAPGRHRWGSQGEVYQWRMQEARMRRARVLMSQAHGSADVRRWLLGYGNSYPLSHCR